VCLHVDQLGCKNAEIEKYHGVEFVRMHSLLAESMLITNAYENFKNDIKYFRIVFVSYRIQ